MSFSQMSLFELAEGFQTKKFSSQEMVQYFLKKIEKEDPKINAFISVNERALEEAQKRDEKKHTRSLEGVPLSLKDNFCVEGLRTTAGSKILSNFVAPYSSTVAKRLEDKGCVFLGKNNMDEFAMGSSTEHSAFKPTSNPWNWDFVPGGSSGGSAAAVASGLTPASMGTDTGGSIRQPAHFCGLVGLKPSYGRISRYGIVSFASSLDQAGPLTRRVRDSALLLQILAGFDENDSTTSSRPAEFLVENLKPSIKGLKIGVLNAPHLQKEVRETFEKVIKELKKEGADIVNVELHYWESSVPVYYLVSSSEASSNLSRYDGVRYGRRGDFSSEPAKNLEDFYSRSRGEGFGSEVKRRILMGTYALSAGYYDAYYLRACKIRNLIQKDYLNQFKKCDVMISPPATSLALALGQKRSPVQVYGDDILTLGVSLAGLPAMTVPIEFAGSHNLPSGIQLIAPPFEENKLFSVGEFLEQHFEFYKNHPKGFH